MADQDAVEAIEIERKYEVTESTVFPDLGSVGVGSRADADAVADAGAAASGALTNVAANLAGPAGLSAIVSTAQYELRATYFDTPDGLLGQQRVAVRRREGGSDAGWHVKTKNGDVSRELMWPVSDDIPLGLQTVVIELIGAAAFDRLTPIADMHTVRRITRWAPAPALVPATEATPESATATTAPTGERQWLVEIADDSVRGVNELTGGVQLWREWEAELAPGADPSWLDVVEPVLLAAGARRVHGTSKLQRIMGRPVRATEPDPQ